jgi:hypothetical protein
MTRHVTPTSDTGGMTGNPSAAVVDLAQYKKAREGRRLPLFDAPVPSWPGADLPCRPRMLSTREAEHRRRMLAHLTAPLARVPGARD